MIVNGALPLIAAALAGAGPGGEQTPLGVTATVVRPAEVLVLPSLVDGTVALIRNADLVDVMAEGGNVRQLDGQTSIVNSDGGGSVTVTLIF